MVHSLRLKASLVVLEIHTGLVQGPGCVSIPSALRVVCVGVSHCSLLGLATNTFDLLLKGGP